MKMKNFPKIISIFSERESIGKTTLCLNIAFTLAAKGKRVLLYDCDANRGLTAWVFRKYSNPTLKNENDIESFDENEVDAYIESFDDKTDKSFYSGSSLWDQVEEKEYLKPARALNIIKNLYIVLGNKKLNNLNDVIKRAEQEATRFSSILLGSKNKMSAKPFHAIVETATHYNIDIVLLDLNTFSGNLNRCLVMTSNYIILPMLLDNESKHQMNNLYELIKKWDTKTVLIDKSTQKGKFPWPNHGPKFMGYVLNMHPDFQSDYTKDIHKYNQSIWYTLPTISINNYLKIRDFTKIWENELCNETKNLIQFLGEKWQENKFKHCYSFKNDQFLSCNVTSRIGVLSNFSQLVDIADKKENTVISFLNDDQFEFNDQLNEELFELKKLRNLTRLNFNSIVNNILSLIEIDS